jgi:hypothetical protein
MLKIDFKKFSTPLRVVPKLQTLVITTPGILCSS